MLSELHHSLRLAKNTLAWSCEYDFWYDAIAARGKKGYKDDAGVAQTEGLIMNTVRELRGAGSSGLCIADLILVPACGTKDDASARVGTWHKHYYVDDHQGLAACAWTRHQSKNAEASDSHSGRSIRCYTTGAISESVITVAFFWTNTMSLTRSTLSFTQQNLFSIASLG